MLNKTRNIGKKARPAKYRIPPGFRLFKVTNPTPSSANGRLIGTQKTGFNSSEFNSRTSILLVNPCAADAGDISVSYSSGKWEYESKSWSSGVLNFMLNYQLSGTTYIPYPSFALETGPMEEGCENSYELNWPGTGYYKNAAFSVGNGITIANSPRNYTTGSPTVTTNCKNTDSDHIAMVLIKGDLIESIKSGVEEIFY